MKGLGGVPEVAMKLSRLHWGPLLQSGRKDMSLR